MTLGNRAYGLAAIALGLVGLAFGDFALVWQPVPADLPGRTALAYAVGAALVLAGAAVQRRRTAAYGAAALTVLYGLCVVLLHGPLVAAHPASFGAWDGVAEQLALVAGGLVAFAMTALLSPGRAAALARAGRIVFGVCLLSFGAAHFLYLSDTAPMVPHWLPPGGTFWAYATGVAHVAAGLAIISGVQARLAARLLTAMFVVFGVLVHAPTLFADAHSHLNWTANAVNLALIGAAWAVADSIGNGYHLASAQQPR